MEGSERPVNADLMVGVGEQVIVTRPNIFGPLPEDVANIVHKSIRYRRMAHSAEDIAEYFLDQSYKDEYEHSDVKRGFVLCFREKPMIDINKLEKKMQSVIEQDLPISFYDEEHIKIGDEIKRCNGPRNHVRSTGEIEGLVLVKSIPYDPVTKRYLLIGLVGQSTKDHFLYDLDKIENIY